MDDGMPIDAVEGDYIYQDSVLLKLVMHHGLMSILTATYNGINF